MIELDNEDIVHKNIQQINSKTKVSEKLQLNIWHHLKEMKKKTLGIREFQCLGKSAMIDKKEAKHIV